MPGSPHGTAEQLFGFRIWLSESLPFLVPFQRPHNAVRDITQQANSRRTVTEFDVTNRLFAGLGTIEKIFVMIITLIQMNFIRADLLLQQRFRPCS